MSRALLGIDVGGTSTDAVVVADGIEVLGRARVRTAHASREHLVATVIDAGREAMREAAVTAVAAVGVGVPGIVDGSAGTTRHAVNLGITDEGIDIGPAVSRELGVPSHVENDVRAAAHGVYAHALRAVPELRNLAYVSIGTGISAGFVLDGELYRGSGGIAGEIGHVVADPAGPICPCGLVGCLEAIASGRAAAELGTAYGVGGMTALFAAAAAGERTAAEITDRISAALGRALYGLVLSHDTEQIVLGGGAIHHTPALFDAVTDALGRIEKASALARDLSPTSRIVMSDPSLPVGAIGAAVLAARRWAIHGSDPRNSSDNEKGE